MTNLPGKSAHVCPEVTVQWKSQLFAICDGYPLEDIYNCDETGIFICLLPLKSFVQKEEA